MGAREWIEAGLLDPASPGAADRTALLEWLQSHGVTLAEMVQTAANGNLHSAWADKRLVPTPTLTREDVATRTGLTPEQVDQAWLAAGFPPPPAGVPTFNEEDLVLFVMVPLATAFFGADTLMAFTRVMGGSMARIAEAVDAMFLADVEGPARAGGATDLELAQTIDSAITLLSEVPTMFGPLFRRHAAAAVQRSRIARASGTGQFTGADRLRVAVGFADLVGYTALSERQDPKALAAAVGRFERAAAERAVAVGARVVKSIGDAVMVVGLQPVDVVDVMLGLAGDVAADDRLTGMRAAVVAGEVLARDGDYVGPTVNLAARATKEAPVGGVIVNQPVADALAAAGRRSRPLEPRRLRGIDEPVVLALVDRG